MKPPKISKPVAKVLDELWPVTMKALTKAGHRVSIPENHSNFGELTSRVQLAWITVAQWHLKKIKESKANAR